MPVGVHKHSHGPRLSPDELERLSFATAPTVQRRLRMPGEIVYDASGKKVYSTAFYHDNMHPDEGCEYSPKCVDCPLPICAFDVPDGVLQHATTLERAKRLQTDKRNGLTTGQLCGKYAISIRTVQRDLARVLRF